jgi:hypothetical protein
MRLVCLRILAFSALLFATAGARAGAWLQPPGEGEIILGGSLSDSLRAYDVRGRLAPVASYKKFELTAYMEYGAMEQVTLIAAPSVLDFCAKPPGQSYAGMGVLEAGARVKLYEYDEWIFSAQATLRDATNTRSRIFLDTGHGVQADARLLIGRSFTIFGFPAFSSLEIGYQSPGGFGHEVRRCDDRHPADGETAHASADLQHQRHPHRAALSHEIEQDRAERRLRSDPKHLGAARRDYRPARR